MTIPKVLISQPTVTVLLIFLYHLLNKTGRTVSQHYRSISKKPSIFEQLAPTSFLALHVTFIEFVDFDYIQS